MTRRPPALLALEDGRVFKGESFGASVETTGEVVFNTAMTGYQEVLSDPSYCGQMVTFTYPLMGNYGVNDEDWESNALRAQAMICREVCERPSNWRSTGRLEDLLDARGVPGICGIDTRALTRHLRDRGVMRGCLSSTERDADVLVEKARRSPSMLGLALADVVTCVEPYWWGRDGVSEAPYPEDAGRPLVAVLDFGVKWNILRRLHAEGFRVRVLPSRTPAHEVLALDPAGVLLSNGPGDPEPLDFAIATARAVAQAVPTFGICLGHQLLGLAFGARTRKLKFGHRGANHPVIDRRTGVVEVTSQNHGFMVDADTLPAGEFELTHWSGNDHTLEGMVHRSLPVLSCQYHPEAGPGPHDSRPWFRVFHEQATARAGATVALAAEALMPLRTDLKKVMVLGAGPIVIGQACEFDYSGTQACRALKSLGLEVVLLNSNPATIMTDPEFADRTYIEPLLPEFAERVIEKERPDSLLPTMGGQTALNLAVALAKRGTLERYNVKLIGASLEAIETAEDRERFKRAMEGAGLKLPRSGYATSVAEAVQLGEALGYPLVIRSSFTLGGAGSGLVANMRQLREQARMGIAASPNGSILIEECLVGWKEFELEVMRDRADNCVIVCSIENFDPMGVHTGDSITVAPAQTLSDRCYQDMRDAALRVMRTIKVEAGGSNIQFAVHPGNGEMRIIEMNPRVSRSSALASKATGFPIAKISALLAAGLTLDEIPNDITKQTPACFEPTLDYCVVKIPRWAFEKFRGADPRLGTRMKSVGEVMAIGRTFPEALMKGWRALERNTDVLPAAAGIAELEALREALQVPNAERLRDLFRALAAGESPESLSELTGIDPWFLHQMQRIVEHDEALGERVARDPEAPWREGLVRAAKRLGLSDRHLAHRLGMSENEVRRRRHAHGITPVMKAVDTCGAEFAAETPYFYSCYEEENEAVIGTLPRVVILGSGPNRIGQGLEFDYCCVQAALELKSRGFEVVLINSNPETVSTDYDISSRLYFEPLTLEDVLHVIELEQPVGVIVQLGGQTPLKLAKGLHEAGVPLWGTPFDGLDLAENRGRFRTLIESLGMTQPEAVSAASHEEAQQAAIALGYPVLVRPSYVLGGRGMRVVYDGDELEDWLTREALVSQDEPVLIDKFLAGALELDVDALCDGETVVVGAVMEHIEEAGIHSGDSTCVIPPFTLGDDVIERVHALTRELALALGVRGLLNLQIAVRADQLYVLEANPRASRTVPFVSKAVGIPLARLAARIMAGEKLADLLPDGVPEPTLVSVKKPVLPFGRFPGVDALLGPEMKSTGEVMGRDLDFGRALAKAHLGSGEPLPASGTVFLSLRDDDKRSVTFMAKKLVELGYELVATRGTARFLRRNGIPCREVFKVHEGQPNAVDLIENGAIALVINTPLGRASGYDEQAIRERAVALGVPVITTVAGALAAVSGMEALSRGTLDVSALQESPA